MLLILRPFRVGHLISAGTQQGTVREIGLFTTIMITNDLVLVSIPNSEIFSGVITNYTGERLRRVTFNVPVDYFNDLDRVEKVITDTLLANKLVIKDPAPSTVVAELQEYSVTMTARAFVRSPDYWTAFYELQKNVQKALRDHNVLIAVSRQAAVVRNESANGITAAPPAKEAAPPPASWRRNA
jgi:small conductance mechanosensitive channel